LKIFSFVLPEEIQVFLILIFHPVPSAAPLACLPGIDIIDLEKFGGQPVSLFLFSSTIFDRVTNFLRFPLSPNLTFFPRA
jgi:hypothetical protein